MAPIARARDLPAPVAEEAVDKQREKAIAHREQDPRAVFLPSTVSDKGASVVLSRRKIGRATRLNSSHITLSRMPSSA